MALSAAPSLALRRGAGKLAATCARSRSSLASQLIENMDKKATWDRFYTENNNNNNNGGGKMKNFEWFFGFDSVRDLIAPHLLRPAAAGPDEPARVLDAGCGTSALGPAIYAHSPRPVDVTCADISPVAVRLMREQVRAEAARPGNALSRLAFLELDCGELCRHFGPGSLDLVVDKGTTDALLRSKDGGGKAGRVLRQCLAALRGSGSLLQFSDEDPDARVPWLETEGRVAGAAAADVAVQEVGNLRGVHYYCYQVTPRVLKR